MQTDMDNTQIYRERREKLESVKTRIDEIKSKVNGLEKELLEIKMLDKLFSFKSDINRVQKKRIYKVDDIIFLDEVMYQRVPSRNLYSWDEAIEYSKRLNISGYRNWRLPTIDELEKLFTKQSKKNSKGDIHYIIKDFLETMPRESCFWSSSEENEPYAWVADFSKGYDYWRRKSLKFHVIFVRDIQF
jgi:hypothetical protein